MAVAVARSIHLWVVRSHHPVQTPPCGGLSGAAAWAPWACSCLSTCSVAVPTGKRHPTPPPGRQPSMSPPLRSSRLPAQPSPVACPPLLQAMSAHARGVTGGASGIGLCRWGTDLSSCLLRGSPPMAGRKGGLRGRCQAEGFQGDRAVPLCVCCALCVPGPKPFLPGEKPRPGCPPLGELCALPLLHPVTLRGG